MSQQKLPSPLKGRTWIGVVIAVLILIGVFSDWIVEWLWMDALGYREVFWTIKETQILLLGGALLVALAYLIPNVRKLAKKLESIDFSSQALEQFEVDSPRGLTRAIKWFLYALGTAVGFFFSFSFFVRWDAYFRFHWDQMYGMTDPLFGHDIGFYLFRLPFLEMVQNSLITLVFLTIVGMAFLYAYSGAMETGEKQNFQLAPGVLKHLSLNLGIWLLLLSWGYYLERYQLLFNEQGVVYGAGYVDTYVRLPVAWVLAIGSLVLAGIAFYSAYRAKLRLLAGSGIALAVIGVIGTIAAPIAVQKLVVEPNELQLETPFLEENIALSREAYDLNKIKETPYSAADTLTYSNIQDNRATLENIRLWDPRLLIQTYRQLQEIRLYYQFYNVDVDRYHTGDGYKQMMLSARELSQRLPDRADTWVNRHLQYTHGYGLVMSPVAQIGKQGDPELVIKDIPPTSSIDIQVDQPSIYYGEANPEYKLVNTEVKELDYPKGDENVYTSYQGKGGVSINNLFEKLLFAWQFGDFNLLLTNYIRDGSKIQFWKSIQTRVRKIAPFLELEDSPYLVLSEGKPYWIQDAYTTSPDFPYSEDYQGQYNYIRNSVKIVVDAYDGTVDFYVIDEEDPILNIYRDIFPDMFKDLDQLSKDLQQHIRYPQHLFEVQMEMYNSYHMTTPQVFYNNEDLWTRPIEKYGGNQIQMEPYYILSKLPDDDLLQYLLISPLTPNNRDNMIAWITAKSDIPNYGDVVVYKLPKERLIFGPAQIEAKIDQDTEISRQLSLWDQRGSKVIRGNLMVIPIDNSFIYVEPVFLIAEGVDIPQLQRVIVTAGDKVAMQPTLNEALEAIYGKRPRVAAMERKASEQPVPTAEMSDQLQEIRSLWNEAQQALKDQDWKAFGEKMDEIEKRLNQ